MAKRHVSPEKYRNQPFPPILPPVVKPVRRRMVQVQVNAVMMADGDMGSRVIAGSVYLEVPNDAPKTLGAHEFTVSVQAVRIFQEPKPTKSKKRSKRS